MRIRIVGEIQKEQLSIDEVVGNLQKEAVHPHGTPNKINERAKEKCHKRTLVLKFSKH
jgi:hypothetical protein